MCKIMLFDGMTNITDQTKTILFLIILISFGILFAACNVTNPPALPLHQPDSTVLPPKDPFVNAQPDIWIQSNPGGGGVFASIGAGPTGVILAGSDLSGAYISRDLGTTWQPIGSAQGLSDDYVASVGFDPQNGSILYFGTRQGIFRSDDGGQTIRHVLQDGYILNIKF